MKRCARIQKQFDERLDEQLPPAAAAAFDAHLEVCPNCRAAWDEYAAAWRLLQQLPPQQPSVGFVERTLRQLDEADNLPQPLCWPAPALWRRLAVAVAALAISTAAWIGWKHWSAEQQVRLYAEIQQADFLEDFDVIAALDELNGGGANL